MGGVLTALTVLPVLVGAAVAVRRYRRRQGPYAVERAPWPTIAAESIRAGARIGVRRRPVDGSPGAVVAVWVLEVRRHSGFVAVDHRSPDGCVLGIHADPCRVTTVFRRDEQVPWFPRSARPNVDT